MEHFSSAIHSIQILEKKKRTVKRLGQTHVLEHFFLEFSVSFRFGCRNYPLNGSKVQILADFLFSVQNS